MDGKPFDDQVRPNRFEIDLGAIAECTRSIRRLVGPGVTLFAALKCNAYGFGLEPVARTVLAAGADAISVVDRGNAIALRRAGVDAPILVYPGSVEDDSAVRAVEANDLIPTLVDMESARLYSRHATRDIRVAVKLDIGQERLGFSAEEAVDAVAAIAALPRLKVHILNSHPNVPANGSPAYRDWQLARFGTACERIAARGIDVPLRMIASSKLLAITGGMTLNAVDPGQMFFGPLKADGDVPWPTARQAFARLSSRLIHVRTLHRSEFIEQAPFVVRPGMVLGVVPIGFADGASECHGGVVLVRGRRAPILGSPSLEHLRIDLSDVPGAAVGDEVVLVGTQGGDRITPQEVVKARGHARTTDLAIALRPSVPRHYVS